MEPTPPRRAAAARGFAAAGQRLRATGWGAALLAVLATVTGTGWAVVTGGVLALLVVALAGWIEAGVVALMSAVCLLVGVAAVVGRSWYRVEISLPSIRTRVGQAAVGEIVVCNTRGRRLRAGVVELPVGAGAAQFVVPGLGAHEEWSEVFGVPARRRGVVVLGPARSVRGDALGLLRREQRWADPVRLWIHPRTVRVPFDATGFQADIEGVTTAKLSSSDVSFHALRDYAPGDDRRHVHWATTARVGRLTVRQFEETRRSHHLIVLDTRVEAWDPADFEVGVSAAASLALAGLQRGGRVSFATTSGWVQTSAAVRLLDDLAELRLEPNGPGLSERVRRAVAARRGTSVLTVVCGASAADADLARWSVLAGMDVDTGVVRVSPGRSPARFTLGRTLVADCPTLDDLPRLLHRRSAA